MANANLAALIKNFAIMFVGGVGLIAGQWAMKKVTNQPDEALVVNVNQIKVNKDDIQVVQKEE